MTFIAHLDAGLVVVNKPAGMLSVPGRGPQGADCAWVRVRQSVQDALVVHRLDMATSGLLAFARGAALQRRLSTAFAERAVDKRYEALVEGGPEAQAGTIDLPLAADWPRRPRQQVDPVHGRPSVTHWQVLARDGSRTRLALTPVTGRTHQLRVHLAALGWPIVGDRLYDAAERAAAAPRLMLHACALSLVHPLHGGTLHLHSPAPF